MLPWLLLCSTLTVRYFAARKLQHGFYIDLLSVPLWVWFYVGIEAWPLLAIPLIFGALDLMAITRWWRV